MTGGSGQLATALARLAPEWRQLGLDLRRAGRPELDFDRPGSVAEAFEAAGPALVVNAAAWTAVDAAERDEAGAMRANRDGPAELARLCAASGVPLLHISTDYVFDGLKGAPYVEHDPTSPTGAYGRSKLAGEQAVLAACPRAVVLRTSWVYASTGKNFVLTMLNAARKTSKLRVVADQRGCPTSAADLARAVLDVAGRLRGGWRAEYGGVFHAAGTGGTTWHEFAVAVFDAAARHGLPVPEVEAIRTEDWPTPARRPPDSRLDCAKLEDAFGARLPAWQGSVSAAVDQAMAAQPAA